MHIEELPKRKGRFIERERVCRERERERERESKSCLKRFALALSLLPLQQENVIFNKVK
jgi:hypothetical protein